MLFRRKVLSYCIMLPIMLPSLTQLPRIALTVSSFLLLKFLLDYRLQPPTHVRDTWAQSYDYIVGKINDM